jgi:hypothetical protein
MIFFSYFIGLGSVSLLIIVKNLCSNLCGEALLPLVKLKVPKFEFPNVAKCLYVYILIELG